MSKKYFYNHLIEENPPGLVILDNIETNFSSISEACSWLQKQYDVEEMKEEIQKEELSSLSDKVIKVLQENGRQDISTKTIDEYISTVSKKKFTLDESALEIRNMFEDEDLSRYDFVLEDGSVVTVSTETLEFLNRYISEEPEILEFMQENKTNFLYVMENL